MKRHKHHERGFTLIELMVSLVLFSLVIAGMLSIAVTMARGFQEQQMTVSAEESSRTAIEYITDAIRSASPGVPSNVIEHVHGGPPCKAGGFTVVNSATGPNTADELFVVFSPGGVTTATGTYTGGTTSLTVVNGTQFKVGDSVMITDHLSGHIAEITAIAGAAPATLTLAAQSCGPVFPNGAYNPGALVIRVMRARFFIQDLPGCAVAGACPALWMDADAEHTTFAPEPLAEGVEDMQIMLGIEDGIAVGLTENGAAAGDDEWQHNFLGGEAALPIPPGTIRAVRVSLITRAAVPVTVPIYTRPAAGDRAAAVIPDGFRRRLLNTIVEVRNLGGSP